MSKLEACVLLGSPNAHVALCVEDKDGHVYLYTRIGLVEFDNTCIQCLITMPLCCIVCCMCSVESGISSVVLVYDC